jgi:hypothetical protein
VQAYELEVQVYGLEVLREKQELIFEQGLNLKQGQRKEEQR